MQDRAKHRRQFIKLYSIVLIIYCLAIAGALTQGWSLYAPQVKSQLVREANITNAQLEGSLLEALKILEVAKNQINKASEKTPPSDRKIFEILHDSVNIFTLFNTNDLYGLLGYVDKHGQVKALNSEYPTKQIDLSDRFYFQDLSQHPEHRSSVGNLVIAKTTGLATFHMAVPIIDSKKNFSGLIFQQILARDIGRVLAGSLDHLDSKIITLANNGKVTFTYPEVDSVGALKPEFTSALISAKKQLTVSTGVYNISGDGIPESSYVGFSDAKTFGLTSYVMIPIREVLFGFLKTNFYFLLLGVFGLLSITLIFIRSYKKSIQFLNLLDMSRRDKLTGLLNRRGLDDEFSRLWKEALRTKSPMSVLFIDIDHFKIFNDNYGHEVGDLALKLVAQTIRCTITRPMDLCCRWGGEEFSVILPSTDEVGAIKIAENILEAVRGIQIDSEDVAVNAKVTVSIGVASMVITTENYADDLINMADKAMYNAKQAGRNQYSIYKRM